MSSEQEPSSFPPLVMSEEFEKAYRRWIDKGFTSVPLAIPELVVVDQSYQGSIHSV